MSDGGDESDGAESRRKRIRQACLNCRRKKVRCGGEKPVCNFCSRLSQACVYAEDGRSLRRNSFNLLGTNEERPENVLDIISSRFVALEDRLTRIEGSIDRLEPLLSSLAGQLSGGQAVLPNAQNASILNPTQRESNNDISDLSRLMTPPAASDGMYPPVHTLLFAADVYFRFCHNQPYSLFHEASFRNRLVSGELPVPLVWALLAAARRYSSLPDVQVNSPDDVLFYANKAWESLNLPWNGATNDEDVLPVIQTIILIVNVEHPSGHCGAAYMKLGFAIRIALHSRLHMESDDDLSLVFREERRRAFWALYLQDKLISLSRERFSIFRDEECRMRLPCSEAAFREGREEKTPTLADFAEDCLDQQAVDSCSPLALIFVLASALGRVAQYVLQADRYSHFAPPWSASSPYAAISSTLLQLELHLGLNEPPKEILERKCFVDGAIDQHLAGSFIYAKALFHLSHCLLRHPFLLQQRLQRMKQKAPPSFVKTAWEDCRRHAKVLTDLKEMRNHNVIILTSFYGYCIMIAGTIHVLSMNDEDNMVREEGTKHHKAALDFLRELSCYWKHAALMAVRLERFRRLVQDRRELMDPCTPNDEHSTGELKVLWQSVDYALLSTPTRPGSPTPQNTGSISSNPYTSPNGLFDFSVFDLLNATADVFGSFTPLDSETTLLPVPDI